MFPPTCPPWAEEEKSIVKTPEQKRNLCYRISIIAAGVFCGTIFFLLLVLLAKPAHAINNPADTTASYGQ